MGGDNDKKIAVIVYGVYVEFCNAVKSWTFLNEVNSDVYFSTWNKSEKYSMKLNYHSSYDVTPEMIENCLPYAQYQIHDEKNYNFKLKIEKIKFHWKNCLEMIENSNKKYDIIMIMRPENYMGKIDGRKFLEFNKKDRIYGLEKIKIKENNELFVQDIFFVGDFDVMKDLLLSFPDDEDRPHENFAKHVLSKNLDIENIENFCVMTLRPNCSELKEEDKNYENFWNKVKEWG